MVSETSPPKTSSPGTSSPGTSSPPSVPRSSEVMGVNRPEGNSSSSHRRTIVIAATVSGAVVLIGVAVAAIFLCCRRRPEQQVYPYNFPAEDITEDPSSSGWVEDAWGRHEGSGVVEHPSLASGTRTTEALRGDPTRRDKGKGKGSRRRAFTESAVTPPRPTASPLARAARWSQQLARTAAPVTPTSSTGAVVAFEMTNMGRIHRHPYAAPTPEPDIELDSPTLGRPDTGDHIGSRVTPPAGSGSFAVSSASMPERIPEPNPTAAAEDSSRTALLHPASPSASTPSPSPPAPAPVRARSRPLPMQPVLESQAHAARSRRFNSPSTPGGSTVGSELPPPYPGTSRSR
ncbi:hypothetical protein BDW22DRAFT_1392322 [Trametopsis cervina]|nr:hypothetical protein BDW22DRAFT_1392322 [Trametopsis cervina]